MWLNELWTRWVGRASREVRRQRGHRLTRTRTRLHLEALEDRTLLSAPVGTTGDLVNAITSANTAGGSTTITLASGTTFDFTTANNTTNGANALPVITANLTIVGNGDTISGGGAARLFDVASGGSLTLENLTLSGGRAQGTGTAAEGGAIYTSGSLALSAVTLMSNVAQGNNGYSGGQSSPGGNGASAYGGGLYVARGTVALTNVTVSSNNATGGNGGNGGSGGPGSTGYRYHYTNYYYNSSGALYNTTQYSSGYNGGPGGPGGSGGSGGSSSGGGLYVAGGTVTLLNDTLSSNQANGGYGGSGGPGGTGIDRNIYITRYNYPSYYNASTHTTSYVGGSRGPSGSGGGGGAGSGGGVYVGSGSVTLHNTLISGDSDGDVSGTLDSASDFNLIGDGSGGLSTANHNLLGINPLLAPLGYYGGPTQTMALLPGSPAINAGSSAYGGGTDQRGEPRLGATDIGAFESQGFAIAVSSGNNQSATVNTAFADPLVVTVTANNPIEPVAGGTISFTAPASGASAVLSGTPAAIGSDRQARVTATANGTSGTYKVTVSTTGSVSPANFSLINAGIVVVTTLSDENNPTDGTTSLREAISYAETQSIPQTITFDPSILTKTSDNVIDLLSALPSLTGNITIEGPGANVLTVQRDASAAAFSVFTVDAGATAALSGLTISGGSTTEGGGGIANSGTLTVSDSALSGNSASLGGGIANGDSLMVSNCALSGDSATEGGGIFNEGSLMVSDSTLSGNSAQSGGGILNEGSVTVSDSTLSGNSANAGSGIDVSSGDVLLHNTLIAGNQGDDVSGSLDSASDYNLIGDGTGGLSTANHNLLGSSSSLLDPLLAPLGNYGGPTETMALLPGSRAIDAGSSASGASTDQRGKARVGATDIGAFESQGFSIAVSSGNNQFATIDTTFADPLVVSVTAKNAIEPVAGGSITFTAPASGASAYFVSNPAAIGSNGTASITAIANGTAGTYTAGASATGIASPAKFSLTNSLGNYTPVSIASLTNTDCRSGSTVIPFTFVDGSNFPVAPTSIAVAGVPFDLVPYANEANSLGVIETYGITTPFTIPTSVFGATTVYTLMNSVWGTSGDDVGSIEFKGANPANDVVFQIVEGDNIRDYFNGSYNNVATNIVPDAFQNGVQNPNGSNRLDMQTFSLPAGFAKDTLTQIIFTGFGGDPQGVPFLAAATVAKPGNLIANGDFESGNIGFTTGYSYSPGGGPSGELGEGDYDIVTNPHNSHPGGESYGDHTTGHGLMMMLNGALSYPTAVWSETVSVQPNTNYQFSGWVSDWSADRDTNLPDLDFNFNSVLVGQFNAPPNEPIGQWDNATFTWNSGNNSTLTLTIIDAQTAGFGNDFALDDLSLQVSASQPYHPYLVTSTADDGSAGTLRDAINQVNAGKDNEIDFNIAGTGVQTINLTSALPALTASSVFINGTSENQFQGVTSTSPLIELNGSGAGSSSDGLLLQGSNDILSGLLIEHFNNGIVIDGTGDTIGGTTVAARNILSGNSANGVVITGSSATGNVVAGNYIGTDVSGSIALPNGSNGVEIDSGASNNTIGGSVASAGNLVAGNLGNGIFINGAGGCNNVIVGNQIGTATDGKSLGNAGYGVNLVNAGSNTIGGTAQGDGNVISGNGQGGVNIQGDAWNNGLLALYQAEGNANDYTGNNDGTLVNGVGFARGESGQAFSFNGTNQYVQLPNNFIPYPTTGTSNAPFSFDTWFETTSGGVILGQQSGSPFGSQSGWVPGVYVGTDGLLRVELFWRGSILPITSTVKVNDGAFHNVAVIYDGSTETVYLDGKPISSQAGYTMNAYSSSYNYQLGTGYTANNWPGGNGGWYSFNGLIDQAAFYTRALSPSEVQNLAANAGTGNTIRLNSIFANGSNGTGPGITLGNSGNNNLAAPSLLTATLVGNTLTVTGTFTAATANVSYALDFYANPSGDAEGKAYLGSLTVTPTSTGTQSFTFTTTTTVTGTYPLITSTLTDATGDTSAFSSSVGVISETHYVVTSAADDGSAGTLRDAINQANAPGSTITEIDFNIGTVGSLQTIRLTSPLPALTASGVYINGLSQGGNGNTKQLITLNGSGAGVGDGLLLEGSNCTVSGLILGNFAENGIEVEGTNDTIGGSVTGAGNVISGNSQDGVLLDSTASGTVVQGNSIGVNAAGDTEANGGYGVSVAGTDNTIGGTAYRARNIIAGNTKDGVLLASSASGNVLLGNLIGVNASGNAVANSVGVEVAGVNNTIGGVASGSRNIISGNSHDGVLLDSTSSGNQVLGNYIGTNLYGTAVLGNGRNGVEVAGNGNTLGSTNAAASNVISGNGNDGVLLDSGTSGNQLLGNYIGTDYTGTTAIANKVGIEDAGSSNTLGGSVVGARNVISGNTGDGVLLDSPASGETVQANYIGLNHNASAALGNGSNGIEIQGTNNNNGGNSASNYYTRNFITGNGNDGLLIASSASGNVVQGNFIGVDITGTHGVGNVGNGIEIAGTSNTVGGTVSGSGNVISGNHNNGILIDSTGSDNLITGNDIGTDYSGGKALGNSGSGVEIAGTNNTIGGSTKAARNIIASSNSNGVQIDSSASGTLVQGNYIGTNTGGASLGNGSNGVSIAGINNTIGGSVGADGNFIAHNNGAGVLVNVGTGNSILKNSIIAEAGQLGISLTNGGNNNEAFPILTTASYSGGSLTVTGTYTAPLANVSYVVQFFASSGSDEGAVYLGMGTFTPTSTGTHAFAFTVATTVPGTYPIITATITDSSGDTSEFSNSVTS